MELALEKFKTRKGIIAIIVVLAFISVLSLLVWQAFSKKNPASEDIPGNIPSEENPLIKKQKDELDQLKQDSGVQSAEENAQIEELDALRREAQQTASPETVKNQMEELEKLRQMSQ